MYSICISGQQYATIMCTNSDSLRCFTFEKKDALYETVSDMKIASYNDNVKRTKCKLITIYTRLINHIFFLIADVERGRRGRRLYRHVRCFGQSFISVRETLRPEHQEESSREHSYISCGKQIRHDSVSQGINKW